MEKKVRHKFLKIDYKKGDSTHCINLNRLLGYVLLVFNVELNTKLLKVYLEAQSKSNRGKPLNIIEFNKMYRALPRESLTFEEDYKWHTI